MKEASEEELMTIVATVKYIKNMADEYRKKEDGWDKLTEDLEELMELCTQGLSAKLINKLYKTATY